MDQATLFSQAQAAIQAKQLSEARRLLMQLLRMNARHEDGWLALASIMDDMHKAVECLQRVLALNPNNATAKEWMAFAEQEKARQAAVAEMDAPAPAADDIAIIEPGDQDRPVPRLGKYLIDYKFITEEQLKAALRAQKEAAARGETKRLGDMLLEQGAITQERLSFAVREQSRSFFSQFTD